MAYENKEATDTDAKKTTTTISSISTFENGRNS